MTKIDNFGHDKIFFKKIPTKIFKTNLNNYLLIYLLKVVDTTILSYNIYMSNTVKSLSKLDLFFFVQTTYFRLLLSIVLFAKSNDSIFDT